LPWYILSTKGSLVPIGGGRRAEATLLLWNKCLQLLLCLAGEFFDASGELQWSVLDGFGELSFLSDLVELGLGWIFCQASLVWDLLLGAGLQWCFLSERCTSRLSFVGGLTLAISFLFSFVCVEVQISCVLLWGLCNFLVKRGAESVSYNIPGWRSLDAFAGFVFTGFLYLQGVFFWRFVSTDSMKPGWFLPTTCVGGSAPLQGAPSAGVLGILAATGAFDFSKAGDAMAIGHLWKSGVQCQESMSWMCYSRRRLKVMSLRRLGDRLQTKDSGRRWRGTPGDGYKDLNVFLIFIKDVFV